MQTHEVIATGSMMHRLRVGVAVALSLALHCGIAYAVMDAASVYGLSNVPNPSISVEEVQTVVLEAITPTENTEPPPESSAQQASVAAPVPTPEQHIPETQVEKTEKPTAAEPTQQAAYQPPPPPPTPEAPAEAKPSEATPAEVAPEPAVATPPLVTIDRPEATEIPVPKPDPEAVLEEQKRQAAEQKKKEEEAQRQAALEQRRVEQEQEAKRQREEEAKRQAEIDERKRKEQREAEKREEERRKVEREAVAKREAEEAERKRKSAQQAKEAKKAKGAEHNQRASAASRGKTADTNGSARTTASRGDILSYAALVRARVASNKPSGSGGGGTVVISFGVSGSGGLTHARVIRSSGNSGLDQAALAAVRRSGPFPATPDQQAHSFSVPFHFN